MSNIVPQARLSHNDANVLTTQQVADAYNTTPRVISNNFNRNKERFIEGKHYFALEDAAKAEYMNRHHLEDGSKRAGTFYLWTAKGILLLAKILNTDEAWNASEILIDEYFRLKEAPKETFVVLPVMDHVDTVLSLEQEWRLDVELHQMSNALHDLLRRRHFTDAELKSVIQALAADIDKFKIVVRAQDAFLVTVNRSFVEQAGVLKRLAESDAIEMLPTYPEMNHINLLAPDKPRVVQ